MRIKTEKIIVHFTVFLFLLFLPLNYNNQGENFLFFIWFFLIFPSLFSYTVTDRPTVSVSTLYAFPFTFILIFMALVIRTFCVSHRVLITILRIALVDSIKLKEN